MARIIRMSVAGMIIEQRIAIEVMKTECAREVNPREGSEPKGTTAISLVHPRGRALEL